MSDMNGSTHEVEARALGWVPEDQFRGDKSRWVNAETFVQRGHDVMPILQANNKVLVTKLADAVSVMTDLRSTVTEQQASIKALTEFQASEVKRQVTVQIAQIRKDIAEARKDGDTESEASLEGMLDEAKTRLTKVEALPKEKDEPVGAPQKAVVEPWAQAFVEANGDWYGKDKKKSAIFAAECEELFQGGLRGAPLLAKAKENMEAFFTETVSRVDKSETGSRPGGSGGGGGGGGKTFDSLPSDAKAQVAADAPKMVGPKKPFKDLEAWKKHFVSTYYATE